MQLTSLGAAAANAYPEAFCGRVNCEQSREFGGPSLRRRSAALVNDDLLIDLGPDIHMAAALHSRPLTNVRHCPTRSSPSMPPPTATRSPTTA